jgi:hypothetical protein
MAHQGLLPHEKAKSSSQVTQITFRLVILKAKISDVSGF